MFGSLLDVLFPRRCVGCRRGTWPLCQACLAGVAVLAPPGCQRCGRPLEHPVEACADCPPAAVSWSRAPFLYAGAVRGALIGLKFAGARATADAFARPMLDVLLEGRPTTPAAAFPAPVVTWVPLGVGRRRRRGYDQAEVLARAVSRLVGWPLRRLLVRRMETQPQARRSRAERRRAVHAAFGAIGVVPPRVVLIDDVLTTGATAAECATALRTAGAVEVAVVTAARSLGGPVPARCYTPVVLPSGSVVARETLSRKSMPAAGEATHVRRPLVAEHGAA